MTVPLKYHNAVPNRSQHHLDHEFSAALCPANGENTVISARNRATHASGGTRLGWSPAALRLCAPCVGLLNLGGPSFARQVVLVLSETVLVLVLERTVMAEPILDHERNVVANRI